MRSCDASLSLIYVSYIGALHHPGYASWLCILVIAPNAASESHRSPRAARSVALTSTRAAGKGGCQLASGSSLAFLGSGDVGVPHQDPGSPKRVGERTRTRPLASSRLGRAAARGVKRQPVFGGS